MTEAQLSNAMDAYGSTVYRLALTRMQNIADAEIGRASCRERV